jgi:hypothetical protein
VVLIKWYPGYMSAPHTYVSDRLCFGFVISVPDGSIRARISIRASRRAHAALRRCEEGGKEPAIIGWARAFARSIARSDAAVKALLDYAGADALEELAREILAHGELDGEQVDQAIARGLALAELRREHDRREHWRTVEARAADFYE